MYNKDVLAFLPKQMAMTLSQDVVSSLQYVSEETRHSAGRVPKSVVASGSVNKQQRAVEQRNKSVAEIVYLADTDLL